jgi:hypothetical protein
LYQLNQPCEFSLFFNLERFTSVQQVLHYFLWSQDELIASVSSFDNASSCHLPSRTETKILNPHHCHFPQTIWLPPSTTRKRVISTLITFSITQLCFHFFSFLVKASRHWNSTCHNYSLSPLSHAHCPYTQRHIRWWTRRLSFIFWITYQHVKSHKNIF